MDLEEIELARQALAWLVAVAKRLWRWICGRFDPPDEPPMMGDGQGDSGLLLR